MKKTTGGALGVIVVVLVVGFGLLTGTLSVDQALSLLDEDSGGTQSPSSSNGPSTARGAPEPPSAREATGLLGDLTVSSAGSMSGYSREEFPHWSDATEFGWDVPDTSCDTRGAALLRDGKDVRVEDGCSVESGEWLDPYTGSTYTDPSDIDIDHFVPLANAWRSGASNWSAEDRETYANDPDVLLATEDNANQQKGDKGPEAWTPENTDYHCEYARRWIGVKTDWRMSINPQEKSALEDLLATCPGR